MRQPRFRVLRQLSNGARRDIPHPLQNGTTGCILHGTDEADVVAKARTLGASGELIAVPESN